MDYSNTNIPSTHHSDKNDQLDGCGRSGAMSCCGMGIYLLSSSSSSSCPRGLITWWGCCGLCFDMNRLSLPTPFYSVLVSVSVFMALSIVFHSINSPDIFSLSHSVLPVLLLPYWSFQIYLFMKVSLSPDIILCD